MISIKMQEVFIISCLAFTRFTATWR